MPNANNNAPLKKIKDFNDEEKAAILARAKRSELKRVAKDFGTTWQVVSAIQRAAANSASKSNLSAKKTAKNSGAKKVKALKTAPKKAARSNDEKRLAILKRASEIGITQAAAEAGISKWTVFQWRKVMKKAGYEIPPAARVRSSAAHTPKNSKGKSAPRNIKHSDTTVSLTPRKSGSYSQIELENEMLKQQVDNLSARVEKLRAALSQLA